MRFNEPVSEFSIHSMRSMMFEDPLRTSRYVFKNNYKYYQYVNPKLVIEWEGTPKNKLISGEGTFRVYEQTY